MVDDDGIDGYLGDLSRNAVTLAEALKQGGYRTYMSGKWHVTHHLTTQTHNWPNQRGFDDFYGILAGAASYYQPLTLTRNNTRIHAEAQDYFLTDAISDEAVRQIHAHASDPVDAPFFQYVAYTAPHWPLHAHESDIAKYKGRFDAGWDILREQRLRRMIEMGILHDDWALTERDPSVEPWEATADKAWQTRRMEVYAAQIDRMDQGIGRILAALQATGQMDNTLILFLADNGGCAEEILPESKDWFPGHIGTHRTRDGQDVAYGNSPDIIPGGEETYSSYGVPWANVSNTPFRYYKHWVHEGGIATPLIVHWPQGIQAHGELRHQPAQLPDVMATLLDLSGVQYPDVFQERAIKPHEGFSLIPSFTDQPHARDVLFWEHEGNRAVRRGKWKLVSKYPGDWELYDMERGRTEVTNLAAHHPDIVSDLAECYQRWAERVGVRPWHELLALREQRKIKAHR